MRYAALVIFCSGQSYSQIVVTMKLACKKLNESLRLRIDLKIDLTKLKVVTMTMSEMLSWLKQFNFNFMSNTKSLTCNLSIQSFH